MNAPYKVGGTRCVGWLYTDKCYIFCKGTTKLATRSLRRQPQAAAPWFAPLGKPRLRKLRASLRAFSEMTDRVLKYRLSSPSGYACRKLRLSHAMALTTHRVVIYYLFYIILSKALLDHGKTGKNSFIFCFTVFFSIF